MADIDIDTGDPQYQQLYNGLATLRAVMGPRVKMFRKLPKAQQKQWLQHDPLMRRCVKFGLLVWDLMNSYRDEVQND